MSKLSITNLNRALVDETRRQVEICNACRYCEGYCSAFPAITRLRSFNNGDLTQIANLCHNCRGCYYACQYTAPHEFDLNLPRALAQLRTESWETFVWPSALGRIFQRNPWAMTIVTVLGFAFIFLAMRLSGSSGGPGFYALLSHSVMVAIFLPAFLLPFAAIILGLRRYWTAVGGETIRFNHLSDAIKQAANMKNLAGGHGEGCNFENEERFSNARRWAHQAVMYGFFLCFASTSIATILHYGFNLQAPYPLFSLPKLFGLSGGILLVIGCCWMLLLKQNSKTELTDGNSSVSGSAFSALLGFVGFTGLLLYWLGSTVWMPALLAIHLGSVLAFFLLTPYMKMAHGFFRFAALIRDAQLR